MDCSRKQTFCSGGLFLMLSRVWEILTSVVPRLCRCWKSELKNFLNLSDRNSQPGPLLGWRTFSWAGTQAHEDSWRALWGLSLGGHSPYRIKAPPSRPYITLITPTEASSPKTTVLELQHVGSGHKHSVRNTILEDGSTSQKEG